MPLAITPVGVGSVTLSTLPNVVPEIINGVADYGMSAGGADNTSQLNAAITDGGNGAWIMVPPAPTPYYLSGQLTALAGKSAVKLLGLGTETGGAETPATLRFTGAPASQIDLTGSSVSLEGLCIQYNNAAFTGPVVDMSSSSFCSMTDVTFDGVGVTSADCFTLLHNADQATFHRCNFTGGAVNGVRGRTPSSAFSAVHRFYGCNWGGGSGTDFTGYSVLNPSNGWLFSGCNFEPTINSGSPALNAIGFTDNSYFAQAVVLDNCKFADPPVGTYTGRWIQWLDGAVGLTCIGCHAVVMDNAPFIDCGATGTGRDGFVVLGGSIQAASGRTIAAGIKLQPSGMSQVLIAGVEWRSGEAGSTFTAEVTGTPDTGFIQSRLLSRNRFYGQVGLTDYLRMESASLFQTTVGAAGGGSALPATPTKYMKVVDSGGNIFVVPCYAP